MKLIFSLALKMTLDLLMVLSLLASSFGSVSPESLLIMHMRHLVKRSYSIPLSTCANLSLTIRVIQTPVLAFLVAQIVKHLPAMWETQVQSLGWEDPLEEGRATHSSILAWRIPRTRSLAGYSSQGHKESDMTERLTQHPSPQFRTLSKGFVKLQSFLWHQLRALLKLYHSSTLFLPNPTSQTSVVPIRLLQNLLHTNLCLRVDSLEPDLPGLKPREEKPH